MKVLFVGPSLPDAAEFAGKDIRVMPPAIQGDIMKALQTGASAIGLIDGQFEFVAPVWHKEILYALSQGIPVLGGSSMGALRAAECEAFGMIGIGRIYEDYRIGRRWDDGDVALLHAPRELKYAPLSVPLVNVDATLENAFALGFLTPKECECLFAAARKTFFKERTWRLVSERAGFDAEHLRKVLTKASADQKRADALAALEALQQLDLPRLEDQKPNWTFNPTPLWRQLYKTHY